MIRTEAEYQECLRRLKGDQAVIEAQRNRLVEMKLPGEQIERAMEPLVSFNEQLKEEVQWYEHVRRRDFGTVNRLTGIGPLLIALRIANDMSQSELAKRLGVDVSQVSRDERNEYHGISIDRAERILDAMGEQIEIAVRQRKVGCGSLATAV
jgi:hypothetical protein